MRYRCNTDGDDDGDDDDVIMAECNCCDCCRCLVDDSADDEDVVCDVGEVSSDKLRRNGSS